MGSRVRGNDGDVLGKLPETKMEDGMETRVLVAYATKYGATAGIAEKIGQVLQEAGLAVDVKRADQAGDPAGYQAVVR